MQFLAFLLQPAPRPLIQALRVRLLIQALDSAQVSGALYEDVNDPRRGLDGPQRGSRVLRHHHPPIA